MNTQVSDLTPLSGLVALQTLVCNNTEVSDLTPLSGLEALQRLYCSFCNLWATPLAFWLSLPKTCELYLFEAKVPEVDPATLSQEEDEDCAEALRADIMDRAEGSESINTVKLLVLGNGRAGKTQMTRRLERLDFDSHWDSTHGIRVAFADLPMAPGERPARLNIWDFGGQDIYHGTHALFLRSRAVFALVWSEGTNNAATYEHQGIEFRNHPLHYWAQYVRHLAGTQSPVLTVQTHCDAARDELRLPLAPETLDGFDFHRNLHFGAEKPRGLQELQAAIASAIEHLRDTQGVAEIGKGRAKVQRQIEGLRGANGTLPAEFRLIEKETFEQWCAEAGHISSPEALLAFFNNTGLLFYREGLFGDRIVLDHAWAMDAIYSIFDRTSCYPRLVAEGGRFTRPRLDELIWGQNGKKFSIAEQRLFLGMMRECGICFVYRRNAPYSENDETIYVAPDLLPERTKIQQEIDARWGFEPPDFETVFAYPLLHDGLMRSLIARIGEQAGMNALYWRGGVNAFEGKTRSHLLIDSTKNEKGWGGLVKLQTRGTGAEQLAAMMIKWIEAENTKLGLKPEMKGNKPREMLARDAAAMREIAKRTQTTGNGEDSKPAAPKPEFAPDPKDEFDYCVSYAWGDDTPAGMTRKDIFDKWLAAAVSRRKKVLYDEGEMGLGDSIVRFMDRLAKGKRVFVFISEKYLRSPFCTYELSEIWKSCGKNDDEFISRIRLYFIPDASDPKKSEVSISTLKQRMVWFDHWQNEFTELNDIANNLAKRNKIASLPPIDHNKLRVMKNFADDVLEILAVMQDRLRPRDWDEFVKYGFDDPPEG